MSDRLSRQAQDIRRRHYCRFAEASYLAFSELHKSVSLILHGERGRVDQGPFDLYQHSLLQLSVDAQMSDEVLVMEYRL